MVCNILILHMCLSTQNLHVTEVETSNILAVGVMINASLFHGGKEEVG